MYLKHYNLQQLPFRNSPDPRFFLETSKHNEALANLVYAVEQRRGFVLLTGEIGSGKTLVTHLLLQHVEDHALVALIRNTHLNSSQLVRLVCDEFSVQTGPSTDKASMLLALNQFLIQQLSEDKLVVIIIDEAQNLSDKVLEELRMLSNLETSSEKLLQIVLVGQPELRQKISQPHLEQLRQRIALNYHLEPLTREEVSGYIAHRLQVAGARHNVLFTPEAVDKILRFSRGTPRIVNGVCDNALLYGFTAGVTTVDGDLVDRVLRQSMQLAPRQRVGPMRTPTYTPPQPPAQRSAPQSPQFDIARKPPRPSTASGILGGTSQRSAGADNSTESSSASSSGKLTADSAGDSTSSATLSAADRIYMESEPAGRIVMPPATQQLADSRNGVGIGAILSTATATAPGVRSGATGTGNGSEMLATSPVVPAVAPSASAPADSLTAAVASAAGLNGAGALLEPRQPKPAVLPTLTPALAGQAQAAPADSVVLCVPAEALFGLPQM